MSKTVLIVEDNKKQAEILVKLIMDVSDNVRIFTAENREKAYGILMKISIDVFLVDIILNSSIKGDTSGIRLAREIRTIPKYYFTPIIFVTSLEDPQMYAYKEIHCLSYIEKPFEAESVCKKVKYALNYTTERNKESVLMFRKEGVFYPIRISDVVYMDYLRHTLYIHLKSGEVFEVHYKTCKQIMSEVDTDCLIQCRRNVIVNRLAIKIIDFRNKCIIVSGNVRIDIGNTYVEKLRAEYGDGC